MSRVDGRLVLAGALTGLVFAVPASVLRATVLDDSGLAGVMIAVVFFAAALAGYGAARTVPPSPLLHGALAGAATFLGAQLVYSVAQAEAPNPFGVLVSSLMFASLGTIGAYVAVWKGAGSAPAEGGR